MVFFILPSSLWIVNKKGRKKRDQIKQIVRSHKFNRVNLCKMLLLFLCFSTFRKEIFQISFEFFVFSGHSENPDV